MDKRIESFNLKHKNKAKQVLSYAQCSKSCSQSYRMGLQITELALPIYIRHG
ncbi:hypothetical protein SLEP1_g17824 [Rubroshorea leprosula]|uniref:Ribosomal protein S14 n=1 Tax=Rubroshorea leprosula TaxID=152421 RepID=A0AAV5J130_9ROSI|nr:hypothetical protein SLEP1_g17824 [Rubroshorea leprosula]